MLTQSGPVRDADQLTALCQHWLWRLLGEPTPGDDNWSAFDLAKPEAWQGVLVRLAVRLWGEPMVPVCFRFFHPVSIDNRVVAGPTRSGAIWSWQLPFADKRLTRGKCVRKTQRQRTSDRLGPRPGMGRRDLSSRRIQDPYCRPMVEKAVHPQRLVAVVAQLHLHNNRLPKAHRRRRRHLYRQRAIIRCHPLARLQLLFRHRTACACQEKH